MSHVWVVTDDDERGNSILGVFDEQSTALASISISFSTIEHRVQLSSPVDGVYYVVVAMSERFHRFIVGRHEVKDRPGHL